MESSSEDSFTWTDTTSDSIDSDSMAADKNAVSNNKNAKKRKRKESLSNHCRDDKDNSQVNVKVEQETNDSTMKKNIVKIEPESDSDIPKKKKKTQHLLVNGHGDESQHTASNDESYLDLKIKQEEISTSKTKKKKKQPVMDTSDTLEQSDNPIDSTQEENVSTNIDSETSGKKSKKKKKKSKRRSSASANEMEVDETVNTEGSLVDNSTFQDETGCEEISAIQCEDDHNLNTFIEKKNESLYKSTILNQFKTEKYLEDSQITQTTDKKRHRISDRIKFEDDENPENEIMHIQEHSEDKISSKLRRYIKTCNNMKMISQSLQHSSILTPDDEVWIVKCPQLIDIQDFCNADLNIHSKCKIKLGGQTYDGSLEDDKLKTIATLSTTHNKFQIYNLPLSGVINFRKRIPKPHFQDDNIIVNNQTNFIPLPEIKCRHPLFGSNYKKSLKLPAAVAERLNPQNNNEEEKRIKKKHKRNKNAEYEETFTKSQCNLKSEPEPALEQISEKKRKKRKHADEEGPAPKKLKKIKHDPESAEAWDSEKAIEQNLFNF